MLAMNTADKDTARAHSRRSFHAHAHQQPCLLPTRLAHTVTYTDGEVVESFTALLRGQRFAHRDDISFQALNDTIPVLVDDDDTIPALLDYDTSCPQYGMRLPEGSGSAVKGDKRRDLLRQQLAVNRTLVYARTSSMISVLRWTAVYNFEC
ncbi:hypothetical protein C8R47DRAFT_1084042 [Mycena vitilis]|nr:hypothetical protein C8R47DRAFT_1084042 [Mycena vitilis]